jgi:hypothetical protein
VHPAAMLLWLLTEPRFFFYCENPFIINLNTTLYFGDAALLAAQCRHCEHTFIYRIPSNPQIGCPAADRLLAALQPALSGDYLYR